MCRCANRSSHDGDYDVIISSRVRRREALNELVVVIPEDDCAPEFRVRGKLVSTMGLVGRNEGSFGVGC